MTNYKGAQHLAVGTYVAALYQGSWYPGRIIRFDAGDVVVVRRTQPIGVQCQKLFLSMKATLESSARRTSASTSFARGERMPPDWRPHG